MEPDILQAALPGLAPGQYAAFIAYAGLLLEWNGRMNLTAITEPREIAQKHFADSLLPAALLPLGASAIDVGTGAGFPGLPLKILRPDIKLTLLDSLQKRIGFLQALCKELGLWDVTFLHARAEDAARKSGLRETFDIALSRAVAPCRVLLELTLPFLRVGGQSLMYKGPQAGEELAEAGRALALLKGEARIEAYPAPWGERRVIVAVKTGPTPKAYPRKAGTPAKDPL